MNNSPHRISNKLHKHARRHQSFQTAIREAAQAYVAAFPGWSPTEDELREIEQAVELDMAPEYDCTTNPLRVHVIAGVKPRFDRRKLPLLHHPPDTSDGKALEILGQVVKGKEVAVFEEEEVETVEKDGFLIFHVKDNGNSA